MRAKQLIGYLLMCPLVVIIGTTMVRYWLQEDKEGRKEIWTIVAIVLVGFAFVSGVALVCQK